MQPSGAVLISIGDELLIGQTINTNAAWMASRLNSIGFRVQQMVTVADDPDAIKQALSQAESVADLIVCTGGLGPTGDDITKLAVAAYFGSELKMHEETLEKVRAYFASRGMALSERNRNQALLPSGARVLRNSAGTAPGLSFRKEDKLFFFLPGVPFEMQAIFDESVSEIILNSLTHENLRHRMFLVHEVGESYLADKLSDFEGQLPDGIGLAYLPSPGVVKLRLSMRSDDSSSSLSSEFESLCQKLTAELGPELFGYGEDTLQSVVGKMLEAGKLTLSVAESCTGGEVSRLITGVAGASGYFRGSVVAYHNDIKASVLGVDNKIINEFGAVSEEVARQMAVNIRERFGADYGLSSTGIAGPGGERPGKPVGTVYLAVAGPEGAKVHRYQFGNDRARNIQRSALMLLDLLRRELLSKQIMLAQ